MIISHVFIDNMRTWAEIMKLADLGEKKLRNVTN